MIVQQLRVSERTKNKNIVQASGVTTFWSRTPGDNRDYNRWRPKGVMPLVHAREFGTVSLQRQNYTKPKLKLKLKLKLMEN
jgi:hypothetical protein